MTPLEILVDARRLVKSQQHINVIDAVETAGHGSRSAIQLAMRALTAVTSEMWEDDVKDPSARLSWIDRAIKAQGG